MKILFVNAGVTETADNIIKTLQKLGYEAEIHPLMERNTELLDDSHIEKILHKVREDKVDFLMSIHFIMNAALVAYKAGIHYISILWDAPVLKVYNELGKLDNVWISTFDQLDKVRFKEYGIKHVIYQPLSIREENILQWKPEIQEVLHGQYFHDVCMVGSLYDSNIYDIQIKDATQEVRDYFEDIFAQATLRWDGENRFFGTVTQEILEQIQSQIGKFHIPNLQDVTDEVFFESIVLTKKMANIERTFLLNKLAERHSVALYTFSKSAKEQLKNVMLRPPVEYGKALSLVYAGSKINLNISLKGIERGTPQRVIEIMGAGGFVMSSYSPETAELFEEDKEIVMFRTPKELLEKVDYYLAHDEEREAIARAGHEKVMRCYTYEKKLKELMDWVKGEIGNL